MKKKNVSKDEIKLKSAEVKEEIKVEIHSASKTVISATTPATSQSSNKPQKEEEEIDIDLTDPEVEKAALKIQNKFSKLKFKKQSTEGASGGNMGKPKVEEKVATIAPVVVKDNATSGSADLSLYSKLPAELTPPQTEEIDIDLNDPEVEKAALKIQNKFSKLKLKKKTVSSPAMANSGISLKSNNTSENKTDCAPSKVTQNVDSGTAKTVPSSVPKQAEEEIDIDLTDPEVEKAALKIQNKFAKIKFKRKGESAPLPQQYSSSKTSTSAKDTATKVIQPLEPISTSHPPPAHTQEPEVDIDLTDPEVEKAAVKIQAQFSKLKFKKKTSKVKQVPMVISTTCLYIDIYIYI